MNKQTVYIVKKECENYSEIIAVYDSEEKADKLCESLDLKDISGIYEYSYEEHNIQ